MRKSILPLVLVAAIAAGCSDTSTNPGSNTPTLKIPKVGSTFNMKLTSGPYDTTFVRKVMVTGLLYDGKPNVMMLEDSSMFAFENNGDVSIPFEDEGFWLRIPIASKRDTVVRTGKQVYGIDSLTFEDRVNYLGEKTRVFNGRNYETSRFEIRRTYTYYNRDGTIASTDADIHLFSWIPEVGFYSLFQYYANKDYSPIEELISFELK